MAANNSPRAMPPLILTDLPADMVQHIVARMTLAHYIARAAPSCHVVSVAARNAIKVRKFSREAQATARTTARSSYTTSTGRSSTPSRGTTAMWARWW